MRRRALPTLALGLALLLGACATTERPAHEFSVAEQLQLSRHVRSRTAAPMRSRTMQPAATPMPLLPAAAEPSIRWTIDGQEHGLDEYLRRQPVHALLIARGNQLLVERYPAGPGSDAHRLSNSMAKTLVGLAAGLARAEGRIDRFDRPLAHWLPALAGTVHGETTLRNALRMGSGLRFVETYEPGDDSSRFRVGFQRFGVVEAARDFTQREVPQGTRFAYAGIDTALAAAAVMAAAGEGLARYLEPRLWQAIGAEAPADWGTDASGLELGQCCLWARPRDWLRLGMVLAHDGRRPDTGAVVIDPAFLMESTDARRLDPPFRPAAGRWGYEHFTWVMNTPERRFALLGVYGQAIFVDPARRLVMVHLAAGATATANRTSLARERYALWQGVLKSLRD
ncbi:MAG: serine hydrolase [Rubrivivax sp.]